MFTLNCKGVLLTLDEPVVMGILNSTPDSFYPASRTTVDEVLFRAEAMILEGAAILDIGGQSTRPGSNLVSADEELLRVVPVIEAVHRRFPQQILSVDTFYASVARACLSAGASIVNDVSGGSMDPLLVATVAELKAPYVLTHLRGTFETMQQDPVYDNVTLEVFDHLSFRIAELRKVGITDIIADPGFGFGKTIAHNFQLVRELSFFTKLDCPLLIGLSRKGTIYRTLGITAAEALNGTTVMHTMALLNGVNILRAHDVKEAMEAIRLVQACTNTP